MQSPYDIHINGTLFRVITIFFAIHKLSSKYIHSRYIIIVGYRNILSNSEDIMYVIPQGSMLGFIVYVNGLAGVLHNSRISIYADDTVMLASGATIKEVEYKLQTDFDNRNKLIVNVASGSF